MSKSNRSNDFSFDEWDEDDYPADYNKKKKGQDRREGAKRKKEYQANYIKEWNDVNG